MEEEKQSPEYTSWPSQCVHGMAVVRLKNGHKFLTPTPYIHPEKPKEEITPNDQ